MSAGLHTLGRWTADRAVATPGRTAILDTGVAVTYRELEDRATRLAARLVAAGYRPGERIATLSGNSADHVVLFFACAKSGLVLVPLSWRLRAAEVAVQLETADPALLVVEEEFGSLAAEACAQVPMPPALVRPGRAGLEEAVPAPHRRPAAAEPGPGRAPGSGVRDDDPVLMPFTSGTEGASKAVVLTHANCFWNNLALSRTLEITSSDVVLAVLPQFHTGGWNIQPLLAWWSGATVVMERTFDAGRVLALIGDRRITTLMAVPAQYRMLAEHPRFAATDLSSLRLAVVGGAAMPPALMRAWHARGVPLVQGYGLTEAGPNVLSLPAEDARDRVGWMGRPYPHVEVAVADPVTGRLLEGAATGELLVAGPSVFAGYFRDPGATARALAGGWLHTGDLVERDAEGYFRIVDRLKDLFVSGGENVVPAEVEQVLTDHPGVAAAAVVGVPDERWGETGHAFVVPRAGAAVDEAALREHCQGRLAGFKQPTAYTFVADLPRTGLEKIARGRLRPPARERTPHGH
ncbi:long-chain fatty acid--CoA ligase [Citricoccus sp. SGAir0253]|uniref:class I adenylate-forming enzyme family protein n=1 Tax=Citricoccus sp. SGAir0253 TaxID=2567881 RepID=UPI0010CD4E76|nr:AMP-binding protein [Citricoccus sp. SGAir0253]QCU78458.1 long-chain fatty acid--CoA ligase [Citricoccus sp. SGAir0253]